MTRLTLAALQHICVMNFSRLFLTSCIKSILVGQAVPDIRDLKHRSSMTRLTLASLCTMFYLTRLFLAISNTEFFDQAEPGNNCTAQLCD
jgi:isochorismate hydrolase